MAPLDFLEALRRPHRPAPSRPRSSGLLRRRSQDPTLSQPARLHTRCACSCCRRLCPPPHPRQWAHPSPPPFSAARGRRYRRNHRVALQVERPGEGGPSGSRLREEASPKPLWSKLPLRRADRPLAARPRPAQTPAVTEARRGDLTRQHGGGGRLGQRVGAAAAAARIAGSCGERLPPPLSPLRVAGA